jgi:peptidoglycan/LPS O-acetylase OafA/YrhL
LILFTSWYFADFGYTLNPTIDRILMMLGAVILVAVCRNPRSLVSRLLSRKFPVMAGKYSYSLYLIHAPILTTVWFAMGQPIGHIAWLVRFLVAVVCIGLGTSVIYQLGEKPTLKWIHSKR